MPQHITQLLTEDHSTTPQSFCICEPSPPSPNTLEKHFCLPLPNSNFNRQMPAAIQSRPTSSQKSYAPFELLPVELFDQIIPRLAVDQPINGYTPRNKDLASCLLVSRTFYRMTLSTLYARVSFPHSTVYSKFLSHINKYPELGRLVKRLDFSQFTSIGLGRTRKMNYEIQKLTSNTLLQCLNLTVYLREFLAAESIEEDVDYQVLEKLFCDLSHLQAVDFCASTASPFAKGLTEVLSANNPKLPEMLNLKRVGLHGCSILPPTVFATLLPRLPRLTHLDLTHTQVTDESLLAIPHSARLTHLSISKCNKLHGPAVVDFLLNHPAARNLVYLNIHYDTSRYRLLSTADVDELLPGLPTTLRSLNLNGAKITSDHMPHLRRLATHLEELSLGGADLSMDDLNTLIRGEPREDDKPSDHHSTLVYLGLTNVASVTPNAIIFPETCALVHPDSFPLQVLEFSDKILDGLKDRPVASKKLGWVVKTQQRRGWYVRANSGTLPGGENYKKALEMDDGQRAWKMGGKWWGTRKVPVAEGEVLGIYGYYAFGY
ncbi:hypothetical protein EX30DRAFT_356407 [Ascodesmis nigricans]|uniref:RNI-like protein n=1 Tax=Ascodesmis nigricans TaxID=341454 RepID=A0A4S2MPV5_9PEZI|nr:hypothetical protein EX30DRAFT_356407 [Ascodesmis nigricans]